MLDRAQPTSPRRRRGVLTLEWILIITVIVIGVIAGIGAVRNALLTKLNELDQAVQNLNVPPPP